MIARLAAIVSIALAAQSTHAQTIWRYSNFIPPQHPLIADVVVPWGAAVERATEGRVKVQVIPALGPPPAHFDLVRNGVADLALGVPSYTPARFVLTRVAELPFLSNTSMASSLALHRAQERYFAPAGEFSGVKLVGIWTHGPAHVFTIRPGLASLEDLRNRKIRSAGGMSDEVVALTGAQPFFAPVSATFEVLSKGVVDGIVFPAESVPAFRLERILKQGVLIPGGLYQFSQSLILSQAKWDALSPADRTAVTAVSGEVLTRQAAAVWDRINTDGVETMRRAGMSVEPAPAPLVDSLRPRFASLLEQWYDQAAKKGVDGRAAWRLVQDTVAETR